MGVHASEIVAPAAISPVTSRAAGNAPVSQPSTMIGARVPVNVGAVLSSIFIVCSRGKLTFPQRSLRVYVRVTTIGHVPVGAASV